MPEITLPATKIQFQDHITPARAALGPEEAAGGHRGDGRHQPTGCNWAGEVQCVLHGGLCTVQCTLALYAYNVLYTYNVHK